MRKALAAFFFALAILTLIVSGGGEKTEEPSA